MTGPVGFTLTITVNLLALKTVTVCLFVCDTTGLRDTYHWDKGERAKLGETGVYTTPWRALEYFLVANKLKKMTAKSMNIGEVPIMA
jgi:hypothetical protein